MSDHLTNRSIIGNPPPQIMKIRNATVIFTLMLLVSSGCMGIMDEKTFGDDTVNPPNEEWQPVELPEDWSNVVSRTRASPNLIGFEDCNSLESTLKDHIAEEMRVRLLEFLENDYSYRWGWAEDDMMLDGDVAVAESSADSGAPLTGGSAQNSQQDNREEGVDYSGTNNQEGGVDEADFVKTDGFHIYVLQNNRLFILGTPEAGELIYESNISIEGSPMAMMLGEDYLVVLSTVNAYMMDSDDPLYDILYDSDDYWWRASSLTKLTVIDISNHSAPEPARELYIEGYYQTAREVNSTVRMVTHGYLDIPGLQMWVNYPDNYWDYDEEDPMRQVVRNESVYRTIQDNLDLIYGTPLNELVPQIYERDAGHIITHPLAADTCDDFVTSEDSTSRSFTSIFTLDLLADDFSFEADHLMTNWAQVYASQDVLVIAESANDWWWFWGNEGFDEATNLHTFDISNAGTTIYSGSGRVNGTILDQFSLSEHNGTLRVATTTGQWGRWWMVEPEPMENHVVTLMPAYDPETGLKILNQVGHVGGIAEGETIWATRFVGDICYMVTFRNMDPLWTIDLSDPTSPTILGELEVPGVSTYIHPMDDGYLLTIGLPPANADGTGLDWSSVQVSQFNVTNLSNPTLLSKLILSPVDEDTGDHSWNWGWSEATYDHKAFQYWAPKEMLAIPMSTYSYDYQYINNRYYSKYTYISELVLLHAVPGENLSEYGTIDHSDFYNDYEDYYWGQSSIRRTIFMGDFVYAISPAGVTAHNLTTLNETASIQLWKPEFDVNHYYYMDGDEEAKEDVSDPPRSESSDGSTGEDGTTSNEAETERDDDGSTDGD